MTLAKGAFFFLCMLITGSVLLVSGCTDPGNGAESNETEMVEAGDTVQVDYVGMLQDGTVFDSSVEEVATKAGIYNEYRDYSPLEFKVGAGEMIEGFDEGVLGMKAGDEKTLVIPPEKAYGAYDEAKVQAVPLEAIELNETLVAGQKLNSIYGEVTVLEVNETHAIIDFNNEFAGKTLVFKVRLVSIESN